MKTSERRIEISQDERSIRLTEEQVAEVKRRLREKNVKYIPAEDVFDRLFERLRKIAEDA